MREPFHTLIWKASIGYNDSCSQIDLEVLEKFGELIVRECVLALDEADGSVHHRECLFEHFGVKEMNQLKQYILLTNVGIETILPVNSWSEVVGHLHEVGYVNMGKVKVVERTYHWVCDQPQIVDTDY